MRVLFWLASIAMSLGVAGAQDKFTGCLNNGGNLVKVALGDEPSSPCAVSSTLVSWNIMGPKGDKGEKGEPGPMGIQGPPGANGMNGENGRDATQVKFRLVGESTDTFQGSGGIKRFYDACDATFPGSRMCTSVEIMQTAPFPPVSSTQAWVRPVIVAFEPQAETVIDASGYPGSAFVFGSHGVGKAERLSCAGWSSLDYTGLVFNGRFGQADCDQVLPVACCAPVGPSP